MIRKFTRWLFMRVYRRELVEIAKHCRKPSAINNPASPSLTEAREAYIKIGMIDALEKLNLLA